MAGMADKQGKPSVKTDAQHYLRTPDGTVYGPVDIATLCTWATDARVIPGCALSADRTHWLPVESFPALRLNWSVQFNDGTSYGPLNLLAIWALATEKSIPKGVALVEQGTRRKVTLDETLLPQLVEECRQVLAGCGTLMTEVVSSLSGAQKGSLAQLSEREAEIGELKVKLGKAEADLAVNMKLISESQRRLSEADASGIRLEAHSRELETLRASLVTARMNLTERESQLEALRLKLGQTENDLAVNLKLVTETQRRLAEYAALAALAGAGNQENEALCRSLASARVDVADRESQVEVLRAKVGQLEDILKAERLAAAGIKGKCDDAESFLARETARADQSEQEQASLAVDLAERDAALAASREDAARLESQLGETRGEITRLQAMLREKEGLEAELPPLRARLESVLGELAEARQSVTTAEAREQELRATISNLELKGGELRQGLDAAREKAVKDEAALVHLKAETAEATRLLQEARVEIQARDNQIVRQESQLAVVKAEAEKHASQLQSRLEVSQQALAAEQERSRKEAEALVQLRAELETLNRRSQELQTTLQNKETVLRKQESALAIQKAETDKQMSLLRSKNTVLEKDLQLVKQRAEGLTQQLGQARESAAKAQKTSRAAEQKLKDELAVIQGDLNGLMLASRCVKQVSDKSNRDPIDWMGGMAPAPESVGAQEDVEARFAKLPLAEKLEILQKELQASAQQKDMMRRDLDGLKGRYEILQTESDRKVKEATEKLAQIRQEVKTTSELLSKTMHEVEKRESLIRELRKKAGTAAPETPGSPVVLEAEVIHAEVLGPDESAHRDPEPVTVEQASQTGPETPPPERILNSVEAQLQQELKKWESLKREKENNNGTRGKWFRWKSS